MCFDNDYLRNKSLIPSISNASEKRRVWSRGLDCAVEITYPTSSENKGNRKYFTVGAGFKMKVFSLDAGYVVATAKSNPLDQTLRFTLSFDMDGIKDIFRRR